MNASPARIWFVLAGVFALMAGLAAAGGLVVRSSGLGVITLSSAAFAVACLAFGLIVSAAARRRG